MYSGNIYFDIDAKDALVASAKLHEALKSISKDGVRVVSLGVNETRNYAGFPLGADVCQPDDDPEPEDEPVAEPEDAPEVAPELDLEADEPEESPDKPGKDEGGPHDGVDADEVARKQLLEKAKEWGLVQRDSKKCTYAYLKALLIAEREKREATGGTPEVTKAEDIPTPEKADDAAAEAKRVYTHDDVRGLIKKITTAKGGSALPKAIAVLKAHGANNVSALAEDAVEAALRDLAKLMKELPDA